VQEAGAALCDGLIDYLFPNAAHREAMLAHPCPMPTNTHSSSGGAGLSQVRSAVRFPMYCLPDWGPNLLYPLCGTGGGRGDGQGGGI
jgi:hypothetical protein